MNTPYGAATVYLGEIITVASQSYVAGHTGALVVNGYIKVIGGDAPDRLLGQVAVDALNATRTDVGMPDFNRPYGPFLDLLKAAKVKSERKLKTSTRWVSLTRGDGSYQVMPIRWLPGLKMQSLHGSISDTDHSIDPATLGHLIREAAAMI